MSGVPELRDGPPWITEEMAAAQPALARALLDAPPDATGALAAAIASAHRAGTPVTVVGCGTSEHGAMAIAAQLDRGAGWPEAVVARQSLDAAARPQAGGVCIGVSHDGGTRATQLALEAAAAGGAVTALVTSVGEAPVHFVLTTPVHDDSWCHTVAYTSAILVGAALARELGTEGVDGAAAEALLEARAGEVALGDPARVVVAGAGLDLITARELALKLAEGARVPTAALQLETLLHGHLAGEDAATAAILVHTDPDAARVERRVGLAAASLGEIGIPVLEIGAPPPSDLEPVLARLLWGAARLQALTLALAALRGVNPDLIRREEPAYRRAGEVAEGDW